MCSASQCISGLTMTPAERSELCNASQAEQRKPGEALLLDQCPATNTAHVRCRRCPDIAAVAATTTAMDLAITLTTTTATPTATATATATATTTATATATATTTVTTTATRTEMNNWDDAEIRGTACSANET
jgi:hypothetical protein